MIIVSNNPSLAQCNGTILKNDTDEVLIYARNLIHGGHKLISHPLYGNIQPKYWYYRTVILTTAASESLDYLSLQLIERAIQVYQSTDSIRNEIPEGLLEDYRMLDKDLIFQVLQRLRADAEENKTK